MSNYMANCFKAVKQTSSETCYISSLSEYSFIMMCKARFDFRMLDLFTVPLKSLVAQKDQARLISPLLHPPLAQIHISRGFMLPKEHSSPHIQCLPHLLQAALHSSPTPAQD